jgi:ferric-dicitrate binding protein FerR (iron transport regulator)
MTRLGPSGCLLAATLALAGCARPFAKLNGVLVEAQPDPHPATAQDSSRVSVTQSGAAVAGRRSMPIRKGDAVATTSNGIGLMVLADGYQVILDPGTDLTIENPSIFLRIGRVIVKRIGQIREALTVKTVFGAAAVEGTEFVFEVDHGGRARISVLEGRVTVYPRAARWRDTVAVSAREGVEYDSLRITRLPPLAVEVERALRRRIAVIEHASIPPGKPFWQKPAFFGPALAAGVAAAVVVLTSGSDTRGGTVTVHIPF